MPTQSSSARPRRCPRRCRRALGAGKLGQSGRQQQKKRCIAQVKQPARQQGGDHHDAQYRQPPAMHCADRLERGQQVRHTSQLSRREKHPVRPDRQAAGKKVIVCHHGCQQVQNQHAHPRSGQHSQPGPTRRGKQRPVTCLLVQFHDDPPLVKRMKPAFAFMIPPDCIQTVSVCVEGGAVYGRSWTGRRASASESRYAC